MLPAQRSRHFLSSLTHQFPHFSAFQTRLFSSTFSSLLNLCKKPRHLPQIHARFILHGLHQNQTVSSHLIDSYANFGILNLCLQLFDSITNPSSHLYNTILRNLATLGEYKRTLLVYKDMVLKKSIFPDEKTYPFVLRACSYLLDVEYGKMVHGQLAKLGFDSFEVVGNALLEFYSGFSGFEQKVVDEKPVKDLGYWKGLIFEASQSGSVVSIINLLGASVDLGSLGTGKALHSLVLVSDLSNDLYVNTALLSMYSKLGSLKSARLLFEKMPDKDLVVWNIMISACYQHGKPKESLENLRCMATSGVRDDMFTAIPAISSIRQLKSIKWGKQIHAHVMRNGSDYQVSVHNSLIDMYFQCDCLIYAQKIFESLTIKTVVSWSSMIKGYVNHNQNLDALSLFSRMRTDGVKSDFITVINILPAFVNIGSLEQVKCLHGYSLKFGLNLLSSVNSALLISYAKCGCIVMARKLFDEEKIDGKDIITWNSMISAHAKHGDWSQCCELYNQMKHLNLKLDQVTFLGLLTACVNSGLVKEGREFFKEMREVYGCQPNQEHYACMVDLLGRAGHINEARELVKEMPFKPDTRVWGPLLSACKLHSETKFAESAAEKLLTMEPENAGNYVLLSNIYAAAGKWDKFAKMRRLLKEKGLKKTPGCSWLQVNGHVHEFRVADQSHPKANDIYALLGILEFSIKEFRDHSEGKVS
ncbi:pentatricopeptide repeat-containing protein At1g11290, chloroplastic-like [Durio zibethinus]|uniref:Pentatricopeptide repeat-containing protein At1g11290, chloroplastic-like n=1 Tax=Durio zibethinus TaxID=66656 RepID=A0A6P5WHR8_DURZI|nr:pentatricopeptide repeat-containing protein At1g11290, chloroplastic-like [Durio zibethinus]XP_022715504.1 pentatricopeptide repeat-containing protein At1g11290, chloroplastic-like [Durio zibethinus]XP_022715505.1 pentatricopeptide repeat-containing protein At1g11290, chloroplastic-like [Durio zibethinus]